MQSPFELTSGRKVPGTGSSDVRESLVDSDQPVPAPTLRLRRQSGTPSRIRMPDLVLAAFAVLVVFFVHFRPWQGGLLEDWGLALAWNTEGIGGFAARLPVTLARPFHLLPHYVGMALSNGGFVGPYLVLGAVSVAQLALALWAIRPLTTVRLLSWATALAIALHPWWVAGDILRFMPAQVSVLGVIIWLGASIRFLASGRVFWAVLLVVAPIVALLTYQAPAVTIVLGSVVLALMSAAGRRRQIALVILTTGASVAVMTWSVVIAPRISSTVYESLLASERIDLGTSLRTILRTLALHPPSAAFAALIVGVIVIALGFSQRLPWGRVWLLLSAVCATPLSALAFASRVYWLNDPERVALPVGLMLWVVLCCLLPALSTHRLVRVVASAVLLSGTTIGALVGYGTWTSYAASQQVLINAVQSVRKNVPHNAQLVVADQNGRFGDLYLLPTPLLNVALDVKYGAGADATLCTPAGVTIGKTARCGPLLDGKAVTPLGDLVTTRGTFKIYELEHAG
jgi:hypothetical protein